MFTRMYVYKNIRTMYIYYVYMIHAYEKTIFCRHKSSIIRAMFKCS